MNTQEAAALLAIAAGFDNRKPDANIATAWAMALTDRTFEDCRDAIVAHYRTSRDWLMVADINGWIDTQRTRRFNDFRRTYGNLQPPARLAEHPDAERDWMRDTYEQIRAGVITHPDQLGEGSAHILEPGRRNEDADGDAWARVRRQVTRPERVVVAELKGLARPETEGEVA